MPASVPPPKPCAACGREMTWRKKWERDWENVKYCSDACRRASKSTARRDESAALEAAILSLLNARGGDKTICPSEAAHQVGGDAWRDLMEPAKQAARRLVARGQAEITQGGRVVDPSTAKGPIRVRLTRR